MIAGFAFGRGDVFDVGRGVGLPEAAVGLGEIFEAAFDVADGVEIFVELVLVVAAEFVAEGIGVFEDEVEQGLIVADGF